MYRTIPLILLICSSAAVAQSKIDQIVAASSHISSSNFQISWSIGEIVVDSFSSSSFSISHGINNLDQLLLITGIEAPDFAEIQTYPNPFRTSFTLDTKINIAESKFHLMNAIGQEFSVSEAMRINENTFKIDLSDIPPGVYILTLESNIGFKKVIIKQ